MTVRRFLADRTAAIFCAALCAGCTVGPNYKRPTAPVPATWQVQEPWRQADPKDGVPKTEWWAQFHDEELNSLEIDLLAANQTLKVSVAHFQQARASAAVQKNARNGQDQNHRRRDTYYPAPRRMRSRRHRSANRNRLRASAA